MDDILQQLIKESQSDNRKSFENSLMDLRFTIERYTEGKYGENYTAAYLGYFRDKSLIEHRFTDENLLLVKHFLFYGLFNYPDRAVLFAKCIKVLYDKSAREAICAGIERYIADDDATCELIFGITNLDDEDWQENSRIVELFRRIAKVGGEYSSYAAKTSLGRFNNLNEK
jgi:hypothetical protein